MEVDVSKPEVHLPLHVNQQLFNTGPLLLLSLLALAAEFRIRSVPLRVSHPAAGTQVSNMRACQIEQDMRFTASICVEGYLNTLLLDLVALFQRGLPDRLLRVYTS